MPTSVRRCSTLVSASATSGAILLYSRTVLAEYRITYYDGKIVRFSFKDYAQGGQISYKTVRVNEFIGRLIRHIPDKYFPMIRHAGIFANCQKTRLLAQARAALGQEQGPNEPPDEALNWAERQTAYTGTSPCNALIAISRYCL